MPKRLSIEPVVGDWYRRNDDFFEVVALDEDDGSIEIQYFDGTVEEMELEDWRSLCDDETLSGAEPPEDYSGSIDVDPDEVAGSRDSCGRGLQSDGAYDVGGGVQASSLDGLDLFEQIDR